MTQTLQLDKWDDQELHTLFAARLPLLSLPNDFAEQLAQTILDEVARHNVTEQNTPPAAPSPKHVHQACHRYPPCT